MGQILGVFLATLREALRQRILWTILLGGGICLAVLLLFPAVSEADRARFFASASLAASTVVAALALLFLAAPSAAREAEERTLHQVLVKPIHRISFFAGRVFAYGALGMALLLGMGLLSYLLLRSSVSPQEAPDSAMLHPFRVVEADSMEIDGMPSASKDWEVPRWLGAQGRIRYSFSDLRPLQGGKQAKMIVAFPGSFSLDHQSLAQVGVRLVNPVSGREWRTAVVIGQEEKAVEVDPAVFEGPLRVEVFPAAGGVGLGSRKWPERTGLRFRVDDQGSLVENFFSAFWRRGLALFLLCGVAFLASVLMNGKLALALSLILLVAGSYPGYSRVMGRMLRGEVKVTHAHAGEETHSEETGHHEGEEKSGPADVLVSILAFVADGLALALPDLDRFDTSSDLALGYNVSLRRDLELLLYLGAYMALTVAVGGFALAHREWN